MKNTKPKTKANKQTKQTETYKMKQSKREKERKKRRKHCLNLKQTIFNVNKNGKLV